MPGFLTAYMDDLPDRPIIRKPKKRKKAAAILAIAAASASLAVVPTASAGVGHDVPNPGWEVD